MAETKKYLDLTGLTTLVNGIKDGTLISGRATADANGNAITTTYATKAEIAALDAVEQVGDDGHGHQQIITGIEQKDGKLFALSAATLDGTDITYTKGAEETGPLSTATTVDQALKTLAAKASAQELVAADKSIIVDTPTTGDNAGKTTVNVNIKSDEKVIRLGNNGIYTDIKLSAVTPASTIVKEEFKLIASDGTALGDSIKIYKDSSIVSINYITDPTDEHYQNLEYTYIDVSGVTQTAYVDMSALVLEAEFASGVTATDGIVHGVVDSTSEKDSQNTPFLTVGAAGFKLNGIKDEIERKINALDLTSDAAVAGQYVAAIEEADGIVSVKSRANVSDAVLTGYAKGTKPASTAIAATDDVKGAIAKIEHQIDDAKAAATTEVVEGTDNDHIAVTSVTSQTDGHTIYTITATDVASESALTAEITARKAIDGQNGQTYAANSGANYISGATSLNDADVKLDAALKSEADRAKSAETAIDGAVGLVKGDNETRTWTPTTNYSGASATVKANMQAIDTQVKANETVITLLNNTSAVTGSVKEQIATAKGEIIGTSEDSSSTLTLNGLKKKIEEAASAATTVVENAVSGQDYVNVTKDTTAADGHTVYKVGVSDIASAEAVGLNSDGSYKAFTNTNYIDDSAITSIAEAVEALDTAIGAVGDSSASTTVYGKIAETWRKTVGVEGQIPDYEHDAIPTLWGLKEELDKVAEEAEAEHTQVAEKTTGHVLVDVTPTTVSGKTYDLVTITETNIASADIVGELPDDASTTYSANTVVQYAKNYTDVQIDALDKSFEAISDSEITALFNNNPPANSGSGE